MLLEIHHETLYRHAHPVGYSIRHLRLTPRVQDNQEILEWRISAPGRQRHQEDAYGNVVTVLTLNVPHETLKIVVDGVVRTRDEGRHVMRDSGDISPLAFLAETPRTSADAALRAFARKHLRTHGDPLQALIDLNAAICAHVASEPATTDVDRNPSQVLSLGRGGCQDHAHLFIACCRACGVPARYVGGYLYTGEDGHAASHAWADAWTDGVGWVSFDVTHQRFAGARYCRLAIGRDHLDACPVRGTHPAGGEERLQVRVPAAAQQQQ